MDLCRLTLAPDGRWYCAICDPGHDRGLPAGTLRRMCDPTGGLKMSFCVPELRNGEYICTICEWGIGRGLRKPFRRRCVSRRLDDTAVKLTHDRSATSQEHAENSVGGPGTELKILLRKFRISAAAGCKCNKRAALMDVNGPEWCERNLETIVDWLQEEALSRKLPFLRIGAKVLVKRAIRNARRKASQGCSGPTA